jgi:hypothetical protein
LVAVEAWILRELVSRVTVDDPKSGGSDFFSSPRDPSDVHLSRGKSAPESSHQRSVIHLGAALDVEPIDHVDPDPESEII